MHNNNEQNQSAVALVVMGPSACGKSEVGLALSKHYQCEYIDADSLHPPSNIEKMSNGFPLTDNDRFPWLKTVRERMVTVYQNSIPASIAAVQRDGDNQNVRVVVACSALKKIYRDILRGNYTGYEDVFGLELKTCFIFLNCSENILTQRISSRQGHFMKANMLQSQLNTLEKPDSNESAVVVNGELSLPLIVSYVAENLKNVK